MADETLDSRGDVLKRILLAQEKQARAQETQATATNALRDEIAEMKLNQEERQNRVLAEIKEYRLEVLDVRRQQALLESRVKIGEVERDKATLATGESVSGDKHAPATTGQHALVSTATPDAQTPTTGPHRKVDTEAAGGVAPAPVTGPHPKVEPEAPIEKPRRRRWLPRIPSGREALLYALAVALLALAGIGLKYFGATLPVVPGITTPTSTPSPHAPPGPRGPEALTGPSPRAQPAPAFGPAGPAPSSIDPMVRP